QLLRRQRPRAATRRQPRRSGPQGPRAAAQRHARQRVPDPHRGAAAGQRHVERAGPGDERRGVVAAAVAAGSRAAHGVVHEHAVGHHPRRDRRRGRRARRRGAPRRPRRRGAPPPTPPRERHPYTYPRTALSAWVVARRPPARAKHAQGRRGCAFAVTPRRQDRDMAKQRVAYRCDECGTTAPQWAGRCPSCEAWNSLVEQPLTTAAVRSIRTLDGLVPAVPIASVTGQGATAIATGIGELDRVLGGGFVPGSVTLIGGEPGVGKSTLLTQVAAAVAT